MEFSASSQFELHLEVNRMMHIAHIHKCWPYKIWFNQLPLCTCNKVRLFLFVRGHKKAKRQEAFNAINLMIYNNILVGFDLTCASHYKPSLPTRTGIALSNFIRLYRYWVKVDEIMGPIRVTHDSHMQTSLFFPDVHYLFWKFWWLRIRTGAFSFWTFVQFPLSVRRRKTPEQSELQTKFHYSTIQFHFKHESTNFNCSVMLLKSKYLVWLCGGEMGRLISYLIRLLCARV